MIGLVPTVRPWWQSAFMFDGVASGGVGVTSPVFQHVGAPGDVTEGLPVSEKSKAPLAYALLLGGSTIGGLLGYGLYGHLRDRGWGPWKSGAAVGFFGGLGALIMLTGVGMVTGRQFVGVRV